MCKQLEVRCLLFENLSHYIVDHYIVEVVPRSKLKHLPVTMLFFGHLYSVQTRVNEIFAAVVLSDREKAELLVSEDCQLLEYLNACM